MKTRSPLRSLSPLSLAAAGLCMLVSSGSAESVFTLPDGTLTFHYPQHWTAEQADDNIRLTAPDGSHYLLQRDTLSPLPKESPSIDPDAKVAATKLIAPLLKNAQFVRVSSVAMDHGAGASFRFKAGKTGHETNADVWLGILGKHSIVLLPERAGQSSQTISLSAIFQTLVFSDALPKTALPAGQSGGQVMPSPTSEQPASTTHTVSYSTQIQPILQERCRACHQVSAPSGGLDVTSYAAFLQGGSHGACIQAGKPRSSTLLDYLTGKRSLMPKGSNPLSPERIALFRQWIAEGAQDDTAGSKTPGAGATVSTISGGKEIANPADSPNAKKARRGKATELMEGYSGHLNPLDSAFAVHLMRDGTATAEWTFLPDTGHFSGAFTGTGGNYLVSLSLVSGTSHNNVKNLVLDMRSTGATETGRYGMDGEKPQRLIQSLELTELAGSINKSAGKGSKGYSKPRRRR